MITFSKLFLNKITNYLKLEKFKSLLIFKPNRLISLNLHINLSFELLI